tara:strand:- start:81 stop:530 length:450 start_codon:yes stop_codon:yes gene_type:complete
MVWLFLIGAAMFVWGGLLAVQPSKTQKRIAVLRESAMHEGLHIKLPVSLKFPEGAQKSDSPYYCLTLSDRKLGNRYRHVLRREDGRLPEDLSDPMDISFCEALNKLGDEYKAVYLGAGLLGISWNEAAQEQVPEKLLQALRELKMKIQS